ncbi:MAG: hypothetical protein M3P38_00710 [Chloroflexota bacterium]|nr:hypothetical protein [Chloroflexota bacterium]
MRSYDEHELARELSALAAQVPVPATALAESRFSPRRGVFAVAAAAAAILLALALGAAITNLRSGQGPAAATGLPFSPQASPSPTSTPSPTATASPAPTAVFPDAPLLVGTPSGLVYQSKGGQSVAGPVRVCTGGSVLAIRPSPSGQLAVALCGGTTAGSAVLLDVASMSVRRSQPVVGRDDVAAWAPDERTVALLQTGSCDGQAPVCAVRVTLWDVASGTTRMIRPDQALVANLRWTSVGLSVSILQGQQQGTWVWDGQTWTTYSRLRLWIADGAGRALLVEADAGSTGGRVWKRVAGQEEILTFADGIEYPLALEGERAIVGRDRRPNGFSVVSYRPGQAEDVVPAPGLCLAAQPWERWLICSNAGAAVLAYSLDANTFARQEILGVGGFSAVAPLPKR